MVQGDSGKPPYNENPMMEYRRFGKTGLTVSVLSAGGMRFMQSWNDLADEHIESEQQDRLENIVEAAFAVGINHFETARGYGTSERQLGRALKEYKRSRFILQTKVEPVANPDTFKGQVIDSLRRLQVDKVDLLAFHGINDYRKLWYVCRPGGCLQVARKMQAEGRVGWVGFSGHGSRELLLDLVRHQDCGGFDYMNIHWYTIFQQHSPVIDEAADKDMGVFIISPTDKGGRLHTPSALLEKISKPLTPLQFNDLFCLQRAGIHTISVGAACPGDYDAHLRALQNLQNRELVEGIYDKWCHEMEKHVGVQRPDEHWSSFPSVENTPGNINISMILWLYNLVVGWGMKDYATARYNMLGKGSEWVQGNNASSVRQYDLSETAKGLGMEVEKLAGRLESAHQMLRQP